MQPGRLYVPAQRHKNAHHDCQHQDSGKLVEQNGHFVSLRKAKFIMALSGTEPRRSPPGDLSNRGVTAVQFHFGKAALTRLCYSRYTANTLKNHAKSGDCTAFKGD